MTQILANALTWFLNGCLNINKYLRKKMTLKVNTEVELR